MLDVFRGEKGGKISMMRVTSIMTVFSVLGVFLAHNILSMLRGSSFVSMGAQEAMLITLVMGGKAVQAFAEARNGKKKPPTTTITTTTNEMPVDKKE